jgi:hypothetical protein
MPRVVFIFEIYFFNSFRGNYTFLHLTIGSIIIPPLSIKLSNVPLYVLKICEYPPLSNFMLNSNKINKMFLFIFSISSHNTQNLSLYINIL